MAVKQRRRHKDPKAGDLIPKVHQAPSALTSPSSKDVDFLRQYRQSAQDFRKPAWLFACTLFFFIVIGSFLVPHKYRASSLVVMGQHKIDHEWDLLLDENRSIDFREQILSRAVLGKVVKDLGFDQPVEKPSRFDFLKKWLPKTELTDEQRYSEAFYDVKKKISVERQGQSNMLKIAVYHLVPEQAARIANALSQEFINYRRSRSIDRLQRVLVGIDEELEAAAGELQSVTDERNAFLKENGWDDFAQELETAEQNVTALKNLMRTIEAYRDNISETASGEPSEPIPFLDNTLNETSLTEIARRFARADQDLNNISGRVNDDHPGVLRARFEKDLMETALREKLRNPAKRYEMLKKQLLVEQENLHRLLSEQPRGESFNAAIQFAQNAHLELLDKRAKARHVLIQWEQQPEEIFDDLYIVDRAIAPALKDRYTKIPTAIGLALLLAFTGFVGLPVFLSFFFSPTSKKPDTLSEEF